MPTTMRPGNRSASIPRAWQSLGSLKVGPAEGGIARLYFVEQTFFRGKQQAFPVDIDAASFEDHVMCADPGLPKRQAQRLADSPGDGVIALPVWILGPAVEFPIRDRDMSTCVGYKDRSI